MYFMDNTFLALCNLSAVNIYVVTIYVVVKT